MQADTLRSRIYLRAPDIAYHNVWNFQENRMRRPRRSLACSRSQSPWSSVSTRVSHLASNLSVSTESFNLGGSERTENSHPGPQTLSVKSIPHTLQLTPDGRRHLCKTIIIIRPNQDGKGVTALKVLLSKSGVQTIGQVLYDVSNSFGLKWQNDPLRHLYHPNGREVRSIQELFARQNKVFIGVAWNNLFIQPDNSCNGVKVPLIDGETMQIILSLFWPDHPDPSSAVRQWEQKLARIRGRRDQTSKDRASRCDLLRPNPAASPALRKSPDPETYITPDDQRDSGFEEVIHLENDPDNTFRSNSITELSAFRPLRRVRLTSKDSSRPSADRMIDQKVNKFESLTNSSMTYKPNNGAYQLPKICGLGKSKFLVRLNQFGTPGSTQNTVSVLTSDSAKPRLVNENMSSCLKIPPLGISTTNQTKLNNIRIVQRRGVPGVKNDTTVKLYHTHKQVALRNPSHAQKGKKLTRSTCGLETIVERSDKTESDGMAKKSGDQTPLRSVNKQTVIRPMARQGLSEVNSVKMNRVTIKSPPIQTKKEIRIECYSTAETKRVVEPNGVKQTDKRKNDDQSEHPLSETLYEVEDADITSKRSENSVRSPRGTPCSRFKNLHIPFIEEPDILKQRYHIGQVLGDGNFAVVRLARRRDTGQKYAMKIIDKAKLKGREAMLLNEIRVMHRCKHQNLVQLIEEFETPNEVWLIMEYMSGGDLFDGITKSIKFSEPVTAGIVSDLANALFYMHCRSIVHRDLKPENVLIWRQADGRIRVKLADFGLAMEVKRLLYTVCGTPTYIAPEILMEQGYGLEVDMWALGIITYIMLCGFAPFRSPERRQSQLFQNIKSGVFEFLSPYWDDVSPNAKELITQLLVVNPRKRLTAMDTLLNPWVLAEGGRTMSVKQKQQSTQLELLQQAREASGYSAMPNTNNNGDRPRSQSESRHSR